MGAHDRRQSADSSAILLQHGKAKLTHEVLVTFMSEVSAIVNARPLTAVSTDPEHPEILTPAMLLTQKVAMPLVPPGHFDDRDLFRTQWRCVQYLANCLLGTMEEGIPQWTTTSSQVENTQTQPTNGRCHPA